MSETEPTRTLADLRDLAVAAAVPTLQSDAPKREPKRDAQGRNDAPTRQEIHNCSRHLRDLLAILDPPYVAALGRVALAALTLIAPHEAELRRDVATGLPWAGRTLVPLYHPGPRAQLHRPFAAQQADFARLRTLVHTDE